jgi:Family of unknown function (DUF5683)
MTRYFFLMVTVFALLQIAAKAQHADSTISKKDSAALIKAVDDHKKDSLKKHFKDPHKASIYSAILPGAGQVYNGKIWKVPIIYTALGISAYAYFYNKSWYDKCQYALAVANSGTTNQDSLNAVDPKLLPLVQQGSSASNYIINYRNDFRKNQDYSALFFLLFWGLNIVDASVDAHLHSFNVSNDLSFKIKPAFMPVSNAAGISLVFDLHKPKTKLIDIYQ